MPACLFDTNSLCHTHKPTSEEVGIRSLLQPKQITLSVFFCPFYQSSVVKVSPSPPLPSRLITVSSCHIIRQRWVGGGSAAAAVVAAVLNFETDRPSAGCQIVSGKWPAYSSSLSTRRRRLPLTETHQWESKSDGRMKGDTHRRRAGWNRFIYVVTIRYLYLFDTFSPKAKKM